MKAKPHLHSFMELQAEDPQIGEHNFPPYLAEKCAGPQAHGSACCPSPDPDRAAWEPGLSPGRSHSEQTALALTPTTIRVLFLNTAAVFFNKCHWVHGDSGLTPHTHRHSKWIRGGNIITMTPHKVISTEL